MGRMLLHVLPDMSAEPRLSSSSFLTLWAPFVTGSNLFWRFAYIGLRSDSRFDTKGLTSSMLCYGFTTYIIDQTWTWSSLYLQMSLPLIVPSAEAVLTTKLYIFPLRFHWWSMILVNKTALTDALTKTSSCPLYHHGFILIRAWINDYIRYKMSDEITYPSPNLMLNHVSKRGHCWHLW